MSELRTPLKSVGNTSFSLGSTSKSFNLGSAGKHFSLGSATKDYDRFCNVGSSEDLLLSKIEYLERERVDLSLQLHQRDEKERSKNILVRSLENAKEELASSLEATKRDVTTYKSQKETLEREVARLTSQAEAAQGLWSKVTTSSRELRRAEEERDTFKKEVDELIVEKEKNTREISKLRVDLQKANNSAILLAEVSLKVERLERQLTAKDKDNAELQQRTIAMELETTALQDQWNVDLLQNEENLKLLQDENLKLRSTVETLEKKLENSVHSEGATVQQQTVSICDEDTEKIIRELRENLKTSNFIRRQLHNQLQELRGNIRVFVRCRPFLRGDEEYQQQQPEGCLRFNKDGTSLSIVSTSNTNSRNGNSVQQFAFDNVFKPESSQDNVFDEVKEFVQSAMDGYRVCIFSYGQTGSGKTHTMTGDRRGSERGITPRAVEQVIQQANEMKEQGWNVQITASMVELYNEELRDLLLPQSQNNKDKLKISYQNGRVSVVGLTAVEINCESLELGMKQLDSLLDQSNKTRSTASTAMNDNSSRSHALFMLEFVCCHADGVTVMTGGLRLCDLAGSERLDRTGTLHDAARLKETVNINKSLSCLADVFMSLTAKSSHIPYRNSKLTMLLQDCLSGDGKSLMIVNASPTQASHSETLCSLRFASQVSKVELGKANRNVYNVPAQLIAPVVTQPTPQMAAPNTVVVAATTSTTASNGMLPPPGRVRATTAPTALASQQPPPRPPRLATSSDQAVDNEETNTSVERIQQRSSTCTFMSHSSLSGKNGSQIQLSHSSQVRRISVMPNSMAADRFETAPCGATSAPLIPPTNAMKLKRQSIMPPSSCDYDAQPSKRMKALVAYQQANSGAAIANSTSKTWR